MKKSLPVFAALLAATVFVISGCGQAPASSSASLAQGGDSTSSSSSATQQSSQLASATSTPPQTSSSASSSDAEALLHTIVNEARAGKVLDCEYIVNGTDIESIEAAWGTADDSEYSDEGKGTYYTYNEKHIVFGANKGDLVFEIRSYAPSLAGITRADVVASMGAPEYTATTAQGESVIGYTLSYTGQDTLATPESVKIKFVFPNDTDAAAVNHYMVLDPTQTANLMADDPGREW